MKGVEGKRPLGMRILHLEDNPLDAQLISTLVQQEHPTCEIVGASSLKVFQAVLAQQEFDLILSDYSGPDFDGLTTLGYCRETCPEIPFIFVSGTIGEDAAIDSLLGGATDYVLKQRLKRLSPAIARAMREIKGRKERKALEQKFLQAQKMEVVGQLSGGIAHDFNNLLAVILGHVELLLDKKELDPKLKGSLTDIHLAAESAGNLTRQLLLISRKQALQTKVVDLNRIIAQVVRWLSRT
jgi:CheY-like chemotaxis protein